MNKDRSEKTGSQAGKGAAKKRHHQKRQALNSRTARSAVKERFAIPLPILSRKIGFIIPIRGPESTVLRAKRQSQYKAEGGREKVFTGAKKNFKKILQIY